MQRRKHIWSTVFPITGIIALTLIAVGVVAAQLLLPPVDSHAAGKNEKSSNEQYNQTVSVTVNGETIQVRGGAVTLTVDGMTPIVIDGANLEDLKQLEDLANQNNQEAQTSENTQNNQQSIQVKQSNQTVNITFNGEPFHLENGQAALTVNGQPATLTLEGKKLTLTDGNFTISTTIGNNSTTRSTLNEQTVTVTVQGDNVTITTGS